MTNLEIIQKKIVPLEQLRRNVAVWKMKDLKIVFTNGCFDLLHHGHIDYLSKAADLGDVLVIGVNSDSSVKKLHKGANRPIQNENDRALILSAFQFVEAITIFEEETPLELIKIIQPDVLVKGGDWKENEIVGADMVKAKGGTIAVIPFVEGYSTTNIENKIKSS
ncbi:MAG: D-glycero-beta-D-manno-heptose 1-phosphate adenylyltransferase [Bacteroidetes bacterium]|nr:D-glycero-beta-D-manno-heptose 1-phosphate adenylyltransferase [Bacteroidota bacterium]